MKRNQSKWGGGGSVRSNISLENEIQKSYQRSGQRRQFKGFFFFCSLFCLLTLRLINRFRTDERRFKENRFMTRENPVKQFE